MNVKWLVQSYSRLSVLWHWGLGVRKSILPVKIEWWGVSVVIYLERGADCLHMVQLCHCYPKTLSLLASFKSGLALPFWYRLNQVLLEKGPLNWCSSSNSSSRGDRGKVVTISYFCHNSNNLWAIDVRNTSIHVQKNTAYTTTPWVKKNKTPNSCP